MEHLLLLFCTVIVLFSCLSPGDRKIKPIKLPPPDMAGGMPLMQALKERRTIREFSPTPLPEQVLSNLLWAAFGINRKDGRRTAPSSKNRCEIDIYVAMAEGLYLYEPKKHILQPVLSDDLREFTGTQDFVDDAPLNLVYVADFSIMKNVPENRKETVAGMNTGFIGQNVYLFCASEGLSNIIRGMIDIPVLEKKMGLRPEQKVILAHTVGYPGQGNRSSLENDITT